jgi:TorA maturation chaperone TorD
MELFRALALFAEPPGKESARVAAALELGPLPPESEYTETFLFQLYPFASVYLGEEGMMGGVARDRVAGFWRALSLVPPPEPDHLSTMLALYAQLCEQEGLEARVEMRESWLRARRAFLWEHLLSWLPVYLEKLDDIAQPFYRRWGETLRQSLCEEIETVGRQEQLPLHLREAHGLLDPREHEAEEFLKSLLAPARSGMLITRSDLVRAGRTLGLGLRAGERKFVLNSLFNQDPPGSLGWLLEEASLWRERHHRNQGMTGAIATAWAAKAESSARLLEELKRSAEEMV